MFIRCRTSVMSKLSRYAAMYFYPLIGFVHLLSAAYMAVGVIDGSIPFVIIVHLLLVFSVSFPFFMFGVSRKIYRLENRRIALDESGFAIRDRKVCKYQWGQISGIGIIAYAADASKETYQTEICIFFQPVTQKELKKLRDSYLYGASNLDRFVLMDYTPALADALTSYSGLPIEDYRSEQMNLC